MSYARLIAKHYFCHYNLDNTNYYKLCLCGLNHLRGRSLELSNGTLWVIDGDKLTAHYIISTKMSLFLCLYESQFYFVRKLILYSEALLSNILNFMNLWTVID